MLITTINDDDDNNSNNNSNNNYNIFWICYYLITTNETTNAALTCLSYSLISLYILTVLSLDQLKPFVVKNRRTSKSNRVRPYNSINLNNIHTELYKLHTYTHGTTSALII